MERELSPIEKIIEEKAKKRFDKDFDTVTKPIINSRLFVRHEVFKSCDSSMPEPVNRPLADSRFAFEKSYTLYKTLRNQWLPTYIKEESDRFVQDVDNIKNQMDDLLETRNLFNS